MAGVTQLKKKVVQVNGSGNPAQTKIVERIVPQMNLLRTTQ